MKYTPTGWAAEFTTEDGTGTYTRPVEKWSAIRGEALIADESGRLVPARKQPRFSKLVEFHRVVAVVPAAPGWALRADAFGEAEAFSTPIAAWVLDEEGDYWPVASVHPTEATLKNPAAEGVPLLQAVASSRYHIIPPSDLR
jgi:hypothetical protein